MLEAKTEEQRNYIALLAKKESCDGKVTVLDDEISYEVDFCFNVDISFDTMAKIVDYLRKENMEVESPSFCRVSKEFDGFLKYDLRDTPTEEVILFCKKLAWVNGKDFDYYYHQYVKTGRIEL